MRWRIRRSGHPRRHQPGFRAYGYRPKIFPATFAIDDPGDDDELAVPTFGYTYNADGSQSYTWNAFYGKRITANLEVYIDSTFLHQINPRVNGWTGVETAVKDQIMVNNEHEFIVSLAVAEEWGATGTPGVANQYTNITPKVYIGKGFGDLETEWLRPIAVTGEVQYVVPTVPNIVTGTELIWQCLVSTNSNRSELRIHTSIQPAIYERLCP